MVGGRGRRCRWGRLRRREGRRGTRSLAGQARRSGRLSISDAGRPTSNRSSGRSGARPWRRPRRRAPALRPPPRSKSRNSLRTLWCCSCAGQYRRPAFQAIVAPQRKSFRIAVACMPELPEVETVRRGLARVLIGNSFASVEQRRQDLRFPLPKHFAQRLQGRKVDAVDRRAKYLLAWLDDGEVLVMHLGMTGRFSIDQANGKTLELGEFEDDQRPQPKH